MSPDTGKNCLACHQPIASEEELVLCGACQAPYHRQCWQSRGGCAMPGCAANPASSAAMPTLPQAPYANAGVMDTRPQGTNGLAIASLVLGILGLCTCITSIVGLILGIVALNQIKRDSRLGGKGLATAGIAVSAVCLFLSIPITASLLFPVFAKARVKARQATCTSQIRQISTAVQMYCQDHGGRYPDANWVNELSPYLGNSDKMFMCPEDTSSGSGSGMVSYGYSATLILPNGQGVTDKYVLSPAQVGMICDATPSLPYPQGGLVGPEGSVMPANRHSKGTILGYCDGHTMYVPGGNVANDPSNPAYQAMYNPVQNGFMTSTEKK